jgi:HAD superfamily hydrolase (TIGR01509 family)
MIKTILFDLDGTIIDSEQAAQQAILDCTAKWGVPVTPADAAAVAGKKWEVAFDLLYKRFRMPITLEECSSGILSRYQEIFQANPVVVPGVKEAILDFARHFQLALVSGSTREDILWALKHLQVEHHFACILGAEDYPGSKPLPDGFLKAMRLLGARPEETIVFEDSAAGIASAKAAGLRVVAIESTNHFGFDQSVADARIPHFEQIRSDWVWRTFA